MSIFSRLLYREILIPLLFSFIAISLVLLLGRILPLTGLFIRSGVTPVELLKFIIILIPTFLLFVLPLATLLGVCLAIIRMNRDNEIIAIFACGINPKRLLFPIIVVGVFAWFFTFLTAAFLLPKAKTFAHKFIYQMTTQRLIKGIPALTFYSPIKGLTIFVNKSRSHGTRLYGVFLRDARTPDNTCNIFAERGRLLNLKDGTGIILDLFDGTVHRASIVKDQSSIIKFGSYILKLKISKPVQGRSRGEMGLSELLYRSKLPDQTPKQRRRLLIEFNKRLALPLGAFILGLLGAPLGIRFGRSGIAGGVALGISAFVIYYLILVMGQNLSEVGVLPAWIGLWIPDFVFAVITWFSWYKIFDKGLMFL